MFFSMSCAILGKEPLDQLEEMVTSLSFGNIEKKNVSRKSWDDGPYDKEQLGTKVEVRDNFSCNCHQLDS